MRQDRTIGMLPVLYIGAFVAAFNENIVNVALVDIMADYHVSAGTAQWLVTGYMMITTIIVAISAYLYRRVGVRRLFFIGVSILAVGSAAAFFAPSFPWLLVCRLCQAVGTGIFIPTMMSTVMAIAPRKRLGLYLSIGGMTITFGPAFGPVVAGLMVTFFGWHTIFLPTLVAILALGVWGYFAVRNVAEPEHVRLDVPSVLLIALGLLGVVFGLSEITVRPGVAAGSAVVGILILAVFVRRQFRLTNPILSFHPMTSLRFWPSAILVVVAMMMTFSLSVLLPLYFQGSFGMTALMAGALLILPILLNSATAVVGGKVMDARGPWPLLIIGFALTAVGQLAMSLVAPHMTWLGVLIAASIVFAGVGLILSPSQATGLATLAGNDHPHGVALLNTSIQLAAAIGPSLLIGILSSTSAGHVASGVTAEQANAAGFAQAIRVAGVIAVVGVVVAFFYTRMLARDRKADVAARPSIATLMRADVFSIPSTASVRMVVEQFVMKGTSGIPVTDEKGAVCGYITDGDILRAVSEHADSAADIAFGLNIYRQNPDFQNRIDEVMGLNVMELATDSVVAVDINSSVEEVAKLLGTRRMKKVPVMSGGTLIGVVTRGDLVRTLLGSFMAPVDDQQVQ